MFPIGLPLLHANNEMLFKMIFNSIHMRVGSETSFLMWVPILGYMGQEQ